MDNLDEVIKLFKEGKIGVFPTDTAYGIGCRMDYESSVKKVFKVRNRPSEKALIALVDSLEMAKEYVFVDNDITEKLIKRYWPGGLTIILKCKKEKVLNVVRGGRETLAVRFPDNSVLREIISKIGVPIVAPSANYSGGKTPLKLSDVDPTLLSKVDFKLNGVCTMKGVSTIVDTTVSPWKVVRQGVVDIKM